MTLAEFTLFPSLPSELRRAIWELCLPRRVSELDQVMKDCDDDRPPDYTVPGCSFCWTSSTNANPPVISAVCHEARQIAWEGGGRLDLEAAEPAWTRPEDDEENSTSGSDYYALNIIRFPWVDKRTDVLHSNYVPWYAVSYNAEGDALGYLVDSAYRSRGLSLMAENLLDFSDPLPDLDVGWYEAGPRPLRHLKEYDVTIKMVNLHVPHAVAARSGLFGLLGDATIQLVDPYDLTAIRNFYDLWRNEATDAHRPKAAFDLFLSDTPKFHALVEAWSAEVEALWVWSESISWQPPPTLCNSDIDTHMWLDWGGGVVDMDGRARKPNREHPEVQRILAAMPIFRPMIMFRLCTCPTCLRAGGNSRK